MPLLGWQAEGSGAPRASVSLRCYPYAMTEFGQIQAAKAKARGYGTIRHLITISYRWLSR
jgi:hypothetical protein